VQQVEESPLWQQFQHEARKRRRNPVHLLTQYMQECLEVWQDQQLDEAMRQEAHQSGLREADAVPIVRRYREDRSANRATS